MTKVKLTHHYRCFFRGMYPTSAERLSNARFEKKKLGSNRHGRAALREEEIYLRLLKINPRTGNTRGSWMNQEDRARILSR